MDKPWLDDLLKLYREGKYVEINFLELADRCGSIPRAFVWLYKNGVRFCYLAQTFKDKKTGKITHAVNNSTIALSLTRKFNPPEE